VQAQVRGGSESAPDRDLIHWQVGRFEQPAGFEQSLRGEPAQRGGAGFGDEAAGERSRRPTRVSRKVGDGHRVGCPLERPGARRHQAVAAGGHGALNELGLATLAVRRHDHAAGDARGGLNAVVPADQVQAQVDPGRHTGAGGHRSVVDVEHSAIDLNTRVASGELQSIPPVRGRPPPVEQARGGQGKCTGAHRDQPCTA